MAIYTNQQLQQLWIAAGGSAQNAAIAAAVAMAESGGNSTATNPSTGSIGFWQINPQAHPPSQATSDPMGNARAAVAISNNGTNWSAWQAFTNGSYKQFLNGASATPTGFSANPAGLFDGITSAFGDILKTIVGYVVNGLEVIAGFWLIVAGIAMLAHKSKAANQVISQTAKVGKMWKTSE